MADCKYKYYVFDAYGTLFDVHSAVAKFAGEIGDSADRLSQIWRTKHLEYSWIYGRLGIKKSFWQLTGDSLDYAIASTGGLADEALRDKLLNAYWTLDAYDEVPDVLNELKSRGATTAILSNGDPDMLRAAVDSAKISNLLDEAISVADAGTFKPDFRVYELVTKRYGCTPGEVSFQSSNRWDAAAAKAVGFRAVWINRAGAPAEYDDLAPDQVITDLRPLAGLS